MNYTPTRDMTEKLRIERRPRCFRRHLEMLHDVKLFIGKLVVRVDGWMGPASSQEKTNDQSNALMLRQKRYVIATR